MDDIRNNESIPDPEVLFRYFRCETTENENIRIESWASENPENEKAFSDIARIWYAQRSRKGLGRWDTLRAYRKVSGRINRRNVRIRYTVAAVAATLLIAVNLGYWFFNPVGQDEYITLSSNDEKAVEYTLPDGSRVYLNKNSSLTFPVRYNRYERCVELEGEAYFDVAKDEKRPFTVSSSDICVRVHGTKFKVKSFKDNPDVDVNLLSGSITFETTGEGRHITHTMRPGEAIRYNRTSHNLKEYSDYCSESLNGARMIRFIDQSLEDIAFDLERIFNKKIIIIGKELSKTKYYASFINNEDIYQILDALNSRKIMDISENDGVIILSQPKH